MHFEAQHLQPALCARPPFPDLEVDEIDAPPSRPDWWGWTADEVLADAARKWWDDLSPAERNARPKIGAVPPAEWADPYFGDFDQDHADERYVLGRVLWQPMLAAEIPSRFFRDPLHARIFEVIRALLKTGKHPVSEWASRILRYACPFLKAGDHCPVIWERLGDLGWDVPDYIEHLERA